MKLRSGFRRKEKLTNHLVINVVAHQGLAGTTHWLRPGHVRQGGLTAASLKTSSELKKKYGERKEQNKTRPL